MPCYCDGTGGSNGTGGVWIGWCGTSSAVTDSTTATTWINWCNTETTAIATGATNAVWLTWTDVVTTGANIQIVSSIIFEDKRTSEQQAADALRYAAERAENQRRADQCMAERKVATARARALLLAMLDVKQREQYERERFFEVIAQGSRRRYRVHHGRAGNVKLLDETGREVTSYCGHPAMDVPDEDTLLAQALMLEHDEDQYLRVANARRLIA